MFRTRCVATCTRLMFNLASAMGTSGTCVTVSVHSRSPQRRVLLHHQRGERGFKHTSTDPPTQRVQAPGYSTDCSASRTAACAGPRSDARKLAIALLAPSHSNIRAQLGSELIDVAGHGRPRLLRMLPACSWAL